MSWRGRLSANIQELRFLYTDGGEASTGLRSFISKNYWELKRLNPRLSLLNRTAGDEESYPPMIVARYDFGKEQSSIVAGFSEDQVEAVLKKFVETGDLMPRSDESTPHDQDVIYMYSDDPQKYQWSGSFSALE